ncbi:uncharacterized protein MELLADRAFT_61433 [Melampsora larici-populina 98AG31]|uniref:C2H2-type domain-containing protein n=1 Tax=Melampsora larici-populina (strain 98AG31 / pathotype 3-4-7) TaxID=747676 RepID=F4REW3_MELLP|nr:uncharacterized protein MELLADRAFT_61433 [Melampsora larici-populina 98AG31]EGG09177.1 hypothetical protein MELLADRAFT_61433 [Melampsora larici-populina 98AG31]
MSFDSQFDLDFASSGFCLAFGHLAEQGDQVEVFMFQALIYLLLARSLSALDIQSEHPISFASQYAPSQEKLMPSLFESLNPDQPGQNTGEYPILGHLLSPQSWTNSFNLVNLKQPDLIESSLQHPGLTSPSLEDENLHSLTNEVDVVLSANNQVASSPMKGKRKRSASSENLEVFQGLTTCETYKIFECKLDPNCFQKFNRAEHLARHERKHTKEKPFKCHCPKAFSRLDNWRQHKQAAHKLTPVANAEQEKLLMQVQKDLQRLNKLRIATIVAETRPVQIPTTKKAKAAPTQERKRETKKAPSLSLSHEASGPSKVPFQPPEPPCIDLPQLHPYTIVPALESYDFSTSPCSSHSQGFPSNATDLSVYSFGIGSSNSDFTPQATYSTPRDFSTSPYSTPMDFNRVISFEDMLHSSTTPVPQLSSSLPGIHPGPSFSSLEPFYFYSNPIEPFPYDPSTFVPSRSSVHFSDSSDEPLSLSYVNHSSSL